MVIAGCITPYAELPLCTSDSRGEAPTTSCRLSSAVEEYQAVLATEVLRRSQWQYPPGLPLQVRLNGARRVTGVCVGSQSSKPGWSTRDRVASSLGSLRSALPGPECLANTTIDLSSALLDLSIPEWAASLPPGMESCDGYRDESCPNLASAVCGVFKDGRRRTFANACEACEDYAVVGFFDFECE
jgi:hypothetical protein